MKYVKEGLLMQIANMYQNGVYVGQALAVNGIIVEDQVGTRMETGTNEAIFVVSFSVTACKFVDLHMDKLPDRVETIHDKLIRLEKLEEAARRFIAKVDCGQARSKESYKQFKEALGYDTPS